LDQTPYRIETTKIIKRTEAPREDEMGTNDRDKGGAKSEYRVARVPDRFPCFARRLLSVRLPYKFKPSNHFKYDGKTEPNQ
jgi:hypothetical protein